MIKAIIFDIGGVVYTGPQLSNEYVQQKLKLNPKEYSKATKEIWEKLLTGKISEKEGIEQMAENCKVSEKKMEQAWKEAFEKRFVLNKELLNIIKNLKEKYKLAILSDQWEMPYRMLITKKIKSLFKIRVFSHQFHSKKPNPLIYKETIKRLGLAPENCIFIDDKEKYLKPARKIGIKTIQFKNNKQLIKNLKNLGISLKNL